MSSPILLRILPLVLLLAFGLLALALPLARLARRHGIWGIVRGRDPVQRVMVTSLLMAVFGAALWTGLLALYGPEALGVWALPEGVGRAAAWGGAALGALGLGLVVVAQTQMGASWRIGVAEAETSLVTGGIFARVRHPIYTGLFALLWGLVLLSPAPWTLMGALWLGSLIGLQARLEEAHLRALHGEAFEEWMGRTGRFLPF